MNAKTTRGGTADVMGYIDAHASPSGPSSPANPDQASQFIPNAIYNFTTPIRNVSYEEQCPGSTVTMVDNSFMDDVAQYMKNSKEQLLTILNQAMDSKPNSDTSLVGKQDSDPIGG